MSLHSSQEDKAYALQVLFQFIDLYMVTKYASLRQDELRMTLFNLIQSKSFQKENVSSEILFAWINRRFSLPRL